MAAADMLVPGIGELIGGSQREERLDMLEARMKELGLSTTTGISTCAATVPASMPASVWASSAG